MKRFLLSLTTLLFFFAAKAQSADDIIAKHIDAIGGKEKLSNLNSVYVESTTEIMGNEASSKATILNGKGSKSVMDFNGQQIIQVATDKSGWGINPFAGSTSATAMSDEQYRLSEDGIYLPDPLFNYAERGARVELQGQEKVGDIKAYKIKYTNKDSAVSTFYIDPSTNYIIQEVRPVEMQGQPANMTISYSDYKKTDFGIMMAYSTGMDMGQFNFKNTVTKIEENKAVDPSIFEMPK